MRRNMALSVLGLLALGCGTQTQAPQPTGSVDRTVLPIQAPEWPTYTELDVRDATPPTPFEVEAPEGAPNVLLVLVDDLGFAGRRCRTIVSALKIGVPQVVDALLLQEGHQHHGPGCFAHAVKTRPGQRIMVDVKIVDSQTKLFEIVGTGDPPCRLPCRLHGGQ